MDNQHMPAPLNDGDYEMIEAAVLETEKGRWFLAEFSRRHRAADTTLVLDAVGRLETVLRRERRPDIDRIRLDVAEMKDAIDRTKVEIAQLKHDSGDGSRVLRATSELDRIVIQTEAATSEILGAAEKLQEIAFVMREGGIAPEICDAVETLVMQIYTACSFQDLTGQRTEKVVHVLRYLESRINSMIDIWGIEGEEVASTAILAAAIEEDLRPDAHLLNGPAPAGDAIEQSRIDDLMNEVDEIGFADPDEDAAPPHLAMRFVHHDDIMALDRAIADDLGEVWGDSWPEDNADDGLATRLAAELAADEGTSVVAEEDAMLAEAEAAMDQAIEVLKDMTGAASSRHLPAAIPDGGDPLAGLSRAERKALFS